MPVVQCLTQMHDVRGQWQLGVDWPMPDIIYRVELSGRVRPAQQPRGTLRKMLEGGPRVIGKLGGNSPPMETTAIDSTSLGLAAS